MKRKPVTRLTPEYEAMIRRLDAMFDKNRETLSPESFPGQRRAMLAEIDALRRLPVIDVCDHCKFMDTTHNVCTHCEEGETPRQVMCLQPVPSWCRLRGAR